MLWFQLVDKHRKLLMLNIILFFISFAATVGFMISAKPGYDYLKFKTSSGVILHVIRTKPDNIVLKAISSNVTQTRDFGINGGFFWEGQLLSMAVMNDKPLKGVAGDYGSGWLNIDRPKGTLVWDAAAHKFSVQVAEEAGQLEVTNRSRYWAQGGVSMNYRNESGWVEQALKEDMPVMDEGRMRSGMVYDKENRVYLIVSPTLSTVEQFRSAVREAIGRDELVDGIFLDGDGSSQLKLAGASLPGDHREVYQMITLIK